MDHLFQTAQSVVLSKGSVGPLRAQWPTDLTAITDGQQQANVSYHSWLEIEMTVIYVPESVFDAILMMHMSEGHCGWLISLEHTATEAGHNHLSTACPCWLKCKKPGFNAQMSNIWKNKIKQSWQSKFCKGQKIMWIKVTRAIIAMNLNHVQFGLTKCTLVQ